MKKSGHTILITGGSSSIGFALSKQFIQAGNTVITCARNIDFSLNKKDPDGHIMRCDNRPFLSKNIPSLLFTRSFMAPVYHSSKDNAETLNYDKIEKASRLLYLVLEAACNKD